MKNNPLISIIVPAFNSEAFLEDCITSLLNNTYKNIEIIIVNDGSTDKTLEIAKKLKNKNNNIEILSKSNGGLSAARNDGLLLAKGDVIGFIDSDDLVNSHYLEKLINPIINFDVDFSYCLFEKFKTSSPNGSDIYDNNVSIIQSKTEFLSSENHVEKVISCAKLFKKKIFNSSKFDVGRYHEDEFFYNKLILNKSINKIGFIEEKLYYYRENNDGIMLSINNLDLKKYDALDSFFQRLNIFKNLKIKKNDEKMQKIVSDILLFSTSYNWERPYSFKRFFYLRRSFIKGIQYSPRIKEKIKCLIGFFLPLLYLMYFSPLWRSNFKNRILLKLISRKRIIYLGSITHGNLGDHAIFLGAKKFLRENGYNIYDLTKNELTADIINIIKKRKFVLALRGGGNIGNIWPEEEEFHRSTIKLFNENKIFFFPESVFFEDNQQGIYEANKSSSIYSSNTNLTIFLRDELSHIRSKRIFTNEQVFCPDMALYLKKQFYSPHTLKKCLFIIREDRESSLSLNEKEKLILIFKELGFEISFGSTISNNYIDKKTREKKVQNLLNLIRQYDLLVTDRLHGMIFSYDVGVPCLALDNNNGKVSSVAKQLSASNIVYVLSELNKQKIHELVKKLQTTNENNIDLKSKYNVILDKIRN